MEIYEKEGLKFYTRGDWDKYVVNDELTNRNEKDYYHIPKDTKVAIDIGAHIGGTSIKMAKMGIEVYAYEPEKENFDLLIKNIELNGVQDKIHAFNLGIGNAGERELYIDRFNTGNTSFAGHIERVKERPVKDKATCITLEEAMKDIPYVDFIKFDCEGGEYEFIPNLTKEMADRIGAWSGELHFENHKLINDTLKKFYKVDCIPEIQLNTSNRILFATK